MSRIYLSPPDVGPVERERLLAAFDSGWIAPLGPEVDAFEGELAARLGPDFHAVALSSGTAALHLALLAAGVEVGDRVAVSSLTFVATANAVRYLGAEPVFVDSERASWNMDPRRLSEAFETASGAGRPIKAVIAVDLYGQCAQYEAIEALCSAHGALLVEDAAEAIGASYRGRPAGSFGDAAIFSFNGNKLLTTSGGGMFVSQRLDWAEHVRHLATQAREPVLHYEHLDVGFNYRLSNLLAAVGRGQLARLDELVGKRRAIRARYHEALAPLPGVELMPEAPGCESSFWLTCMTIESTAFGCERDEIIAALAAADIEARPVWKPMHLQPVFQGFETVGGEVAADLFERGLCLPSGSSLSASDQARVCDIVAGCHRPAT